MASIFRLPSLSSWNLKQWARACGEANCFAAMNVNMFLSVYSRMILYQWIAFRLALKTVGFYLKRNPIYLKYFHFQEKDVKLKFLLCRFCPFKTPASAYKVTSDVNSFRNVRVTVKKQLQVTIWYYLFICNVTYIQKACYMHYMMYSSLRELLILHSVQIDPLHPHLSTYIKHIDFFQHTLADSILSEQTNLKMAEGNPALIFSFSVFASLASFVWMIKVNLFLRLSFMYCISPLLT